MTSDKLFTVCKAFTFQAAHHLPFHDGQCRHLHGHSYRVEVTATGALFTNGPKRGMVIDFGDLGGIWKQYLEPRLDHRDLNQSLPVTHTTAELIAAWILEQFRTHVPRTHSQDVKLTVTVYETATSWARVE